MNHLESSQEKQKQRIDDFSDPECNVARTQGEEEHKTEEHCGKEKQCHASAASVSKHRGNPGGKGGCGTSRNGKAGANGQVEQAGEKIGIGAVDLAAEVKETGAPAEAERGDAQQRQAHAGDEKAEEGGPHLAAGLLAHADGEDEVARTEEQAEQHACHHNIFFQGQVTFHRF